MTKKELRAAHIEAIKEDPMQTWAAAMRSDSKALEAEENAAADFDKEYTKQLARIKAEGEDAVIKSCPCLSTSICFAYACSKYPEATDKIKAKAKAEKDKHTQAFVSFVFAKYHL